jgi:hypothetical protein
LWLCGWGEVAGAGAEAGDLAGAEIDEEVELGVGVGESGRDGGAVVGSSAIMRSVSSSLKSAKPDWRMSTRFASTAMTGRRRQRIQRMICDSSNMGGVSLGFGWVGVGGYRSRSGFRVGL